MLATMPQRRRVPLSAESLSSCQTKIGQSANPAAIRWNSYCSSTCQSYRLIVMGNNCFNSSTAWTGDSCDRGWEAFANHSSLCRTIAQENAKPATASLNKFPAKAIHSWLAIDDSPDSAEHDRLGIKIDYHFNDVPYQPMEFWCPELDLHFVGSKSIDCLEKNVAAADGDKLGGWPRWIQGVEYPACPECGAEMVLVMQIDSEGNVPYMFGDCGVGHITQCPTHHHVVTFAWACS